MSRLIILFQAFLAALLLDDLSGCSDCGSSCGESSGGGDSSSAESGDSSAGDSSARADSSGKRRSAVPDPGDYADIPTPLETSTGRSGR
jgi:hypothetical protein